MRFRAFRTLGLVVRLGIEGSGFPCETWRSRVQGLVAKLGDLGFRALQEKGQSPYYDAAWKGVISIYTYIGNYYLYIYIHTHICI